MPKQNIINEVFQKLTGVSLGDVFSGALGGISSLIENIKNALGGFGNADTSSLTSFIDNLKSKLGNLNNVGDWLCEKVNALISFLRGNTPTLSDCADGVGSVLSTLVNGLVSIFNSIDFNKIVQLVEGGVLTSIGVGVSRFVNNITLL